MKPSTQLAAEASLMMTHAISRGLTVPVADIETIVHVNDLLANEKTIGASKQAEFLSAYTRLAQLIIPVTIESLSVFFDKDGNRLNATFADRAVRRYTILAFVTFLLLSATQIFWTVGSGLISDLTDAKSQFDAVSVQFLPYLHLTEKWDPSKPMPPPLSTEERTTERALGQQVESSLEIMRGYYAGLVNWNHLAWHRAARDSSEEPDYQEYSFIISAGESQQIATDTASAKFALQAIQTFILPLFYGLLGSLIYILRRLSSEIRSVTYLPYNDYRLRIPTGALAGVAIGWMFNSSDVTGPLKSLPPLALAFLAGYSVELLFTGLDRLVGSSSRESWDKSVA
jgi:hypothetical protein